MMVNTNNLLNKTLHFLSVAALCIMTGLVFMNVILRYFFHSGIPWSEEFARVCFVCVIFSGIVIAARSESHLTVDIITSNVAKPVQHVLAVLSGLIITGMALVVFYGAGKLIALTYAQKMPATGISAAWLYVASALSMLIYAAIALLNIFKRFRNSDRGHK